MKKKIIWIALAALILIPVVQPLFVSYIPGTADGMAHKFRLVAFHDAINEGYLRPRWLGEVALGFGAPIFLFNYVLPYYIIDLIYRSGAGVNLSGQIYGSITLILSFITMYLAASKLWGKRAGMVAAAVYTWAPYHLSSVYLYEGWGEMGGYIFPPLILFFIVSLTDKVKLITSGDQRFPPQRDPRCCKSSFFGYSIGTKIPTSSAGRKDQKFNVKFLSFKFKPVFDLCTLIFALIVLFWFLFILTHNVSVVMFSPVLIFMAYVLSGKDKKPFLITVSAFITSALISAFFSLPAVLLNNLTTYYQLIDDAVKWRWRFYKPIGDLTNKTVELLTAPQAHYEDFSLGIPFLIIISVGIIYMLIKFIGLVFIKSKDQRSKIKDPAFAKAIAGRQKLILNFKDYIQNTDNDNLIITLVITLFLSLFLVNPASGFIWDTGVLNWIVYPFRFLFLTVFTGSLLAGKFGGKNILFALILILATFASGRAYTKPYVDIFPWDGEYFLQPQTISNPPNTKKNMAIGEFLPRWEDMNFLLNTQAEYYTTGKVPPKFILSTSSGKISQSRVRSEKITAAMELSKADTLTVNTLYFPNWEARIDGQRVSIERDNVGRIEIPVTAGTHRLELVFGYSLIEKIGIVISIIGLIIFLFELYFLTYFFVRSKK